MKTKINISASSRDQAIRHASNKVGSITATQDGKEYFFTYQSEGKVKKSRTEPYVLSCIHHSEKMLETACSAMGIKDPEPILARFRAHGGLWTEYLPDQAPRTWAPPRFQPEHGHAFYFFRYAWNSERYVLCSFEPSFSRPWHMDSLIGTQIEPSPEQEREAMKKLKGMIDECR